MKKFLVMTVVNEEDMIKITNEHKGIGISTDLGYTTITRASVMSGDRKTVFSVANIELDRMNGEMVESEELK